MFGSSVVTRAVRGPALLTGTRTSTGRAIELEREQKLLPRVERIGQAKQHQLRSTRFEHEGGARLDGQATLDLAHLHDAVGGHRRLIDFHGFGRLGVHALEHVGFMALIGDGHVSGHASVCSARWTSPGIGHANPPRLRRPDRESDKDERCERKQKSDTDFDEAKLAEPEHPRSP
jgi:hypothetical protein